MRRLFSFLDDTRHKNGPALVRHCASLLLLAWIPAQALSFAVLPFAPGPAEPDYFSTPYRAVITAVLLAPLLETQMMRFNFWILSKYIKHDRYLIGASSLLWGAFHFKSGGWGTPAVWAFFIMGSCYFQLARVSTDRAVVTTTIVHAFFNALSYALYLAIRPA